MRYYKIVLKNATSGEVIRPASMTNLDADSSYASYAGGATLPGALNVELDLPVSSFATPAGAAYVKIWGVSLAEIAQSNDLAGCKIEVYGGMQKGLPLAKPAQAGLLVQGVVSQAFGNWVGTEMSLDLIVVADAGTSEAPKNIVLDWKKGATLSDALSSTLTNAFPGSTAKINIDPGLVATQDQQGFYATMTQLNSYLVSASKGIIKRDGYIGVQVAQLGNAFNVYDGTTKSTPKEIAFEDLLGQPTWIGPSVVQFKTVMRADVVLDDYVKLPAPQVSATAAGTPPFGSGIKQKSAFQGSFQIIDVHSYGSFRQPDAYAWNTTFNAVPELQ